MLLYYFGEILPAGVIHYLLEYCDGKCLSNVFIAVASTSTSLSALGTIACAKDNAFGGGDDDHNGEDKSKEGNCVPAQLYFRHNSALLPMLDSLRNRLTEVLLRQEQSSSLTNISNDQRECIERILSQLPLGNNIVTNHVDIATDQRKKQQLVDFVRLWAKYCAVLYFLEECAYPITNDNNDSKTSYEWPIWYGNLNFSSPTGAFESHQGIDVVVTSYSWSVKDVNYWRRLMGRGGQESCRMNRDYTHEPHRFIPTTPLGRMRAISLDDRDRLLNVADNITQSDEVLVPPRHTRRRHNLWNKGSIKIMSSKQSQDRLKRFFGSNDNTNNGETQGPASQSKQRASSNNNLIWPLQCDGGHGRLDLFAFWYHPLCFDDEEIQVEKLSSSDLSIDTEDLMMQLIKSKLEHTADIV